MKKPTWVIVVGVLGIIFSCFGILGAGQEMMMPKMMKFQKEMFTQMEEGMRQEVEEEQAEQMDEESEGQNNAEAFPFEMLEFMERMWNFPDWFGTWSVIGGILKLIVSGFFLYASICLLQLKPFSIQLFYWAAGLSISLAAVKGIVALFASSFMALMMIFGGLMGIVIDIVLVVIVATGNKDAFISKSPPSLSRSI